METSEKVSNGNAARYARAFKIIRAGRVDIMGNDCAIVGSQSSNTIYDVDYARGTCKCPDYVHRSAECKHIKAARIVAGIIVVTAPPAVGERVTRREMPVA